MGTGWNGRAEDGEDHMAPKTRRAIIIGAGPTGLAVAACLKEAGVEPVILERAMSVGASWRGHYDCLRLHTVRGRSGLPGMPFPASADRYPTRAEVVTYLESYTQAKGLAPRFGCEVTEIRPEGSGWRVTHSGGTEVAEAVVMATGLNGTPRLPEWAGGFAGPVVHSSAYRNPEPFKGQRVLVVGFGNSGGDISLDLGRAGVAVALAVRGPVQILPKELFGVPITSFGTLSRLLGPRLADRLTAPILRMRVGRPEDYGLRAHEKGPATMVAEDGRIPLIDVGTLGAIREGLITVKPGVAAVEGQEVCFADGSLAEFDAIIAATGYEVNLRPLLGEECAALDHKGQPKVSGGPTACPGLYFCSYVASSQGQLRASSQEAEAIARHLSGMAAVPA